MQQRGYRIERREQARGTSYRVQAWDPRVQRYTATRTFASWKHRSARDAERAAERWGREQALAYRAGLVAPACAGPVSTERVLEEWLNDKRARGANPGHLATVATRLARLAQYCPDLAAADAARQVHAWWQAWRAEPRQFGGRADARPGRRTDGQPKSARTQNHGLADVRAFLAWAHRSAALTGLTTAVDVSWIAPLRTGHQLRPQFTVAEVAQALRLHAHPFRLRWALYAYTGARLREALQLRWEDIQGAHIRLLGKGRKERLVPLQAELVTILRLARRGGADYGGYLFPEQVRRDDSGNCARRFDAYLRAAGIAKAGRSAHALRHGYAGLMTATGEPTGLLQSYLGHASGDMTRHYAELAARYRAEVGSWPRGELRFLLV